MYQIVLFISVFMICACAQVVQAPLTATSLAFNGVKFYINSITPSEIEITVSATSTSKEGAIDNALVTSVQKALGVLIVSESTVSNDAIIKDIAISYTNGVVKSYKVNSCVSDLRTTCEITAIVSPSLIQTKLLQNGASIQVDGDQLYGQHHVIKNNIIQRKKLTEYYLNQYRHTAIELSILSISTPPSTSERIPIEIKYKVHFNDSKKNEIISFLKKLQSDTNALSLPTTLDTHQVKVIYGVSQYLNSNNQILINTYDEEFERKLIVAISKPISISFAPFNYCESINTSWMGILVDIKENEQRSKVIFINPSDLKKLNQIELKNNCT